MAEVRFVEATRLFRGMWIPAVNAVNLDVRDGELMVVAGQSGAGKSTLLRMLAGLEPVDRGRVLVDGQDVSAVKPDKRGVSMVFQGFALFPHLTVFENIALPLTMRKASAKTVGARVGQVAEQCGLTSYLGARPETLDFEVRQRTTMARAIINKPKVVCLDEPLAGSGIPPMMRGRTPIADLQRELGITMLYATCSTSWAFADRVAVLDRGVLQQTDSPRAVVERPASVTVAQFVGSPPMNLIRTVVEHGHALLGDLRIEVGAKQLEALTGNRIVVGLHPEDLLIGASGGGIRATATLVRDIGREYQVHARTDIGDGTVDLVIRHIEGTPPDRGEALVLGAVADRARLFDADTGLRLPD